MYVCMDWRHTNIDIKQCRFWDVLSPLGCPPMNYYSPKFNLLCLWRVVIHPGNGFSRRIGGQLPTALEIENNSPWEGGSLRLCDGWLSQCNTKPFLCINSECLKRLISFWLLHKFCFILFNVVTLVFL